MITISIKDFIKGTIYASVLGYLGVWMLKNPIEFFILLFILIIAGEI